MGTEVIVTIVGGSITVIVALIGGITRMSDVQKLQSIQSVLTEIPDTEENKTIINRLKSARCQIADRLSTNEEKRRTIRGERIAVVACGVAAPATYSIGIYLVENNDTPGTVGFDAWIALIAALGFFAAMLFFLVQTLQR